MLFSGHPLVGKTVVIRTSQPTATVLGDVRALPRHALWETSGVMARLQVAQYQRVVEARVAQAATRGSFAGRLKCPISDRKFELIGWFD